MAHRSLLVLIAFFLHSMASAQTYQRFCSYTTLSGFYDIQSTWRTPQYIRVNPANGNIHVIYMTSYDSTDPGGQSRRTAYAFSNNGGQTWNNFGNLTVPSRRSGFPTLDLLRGPLAGLPAIANHSVAVVYLQSTVFVDQPEGTGAFSELGAPPLMGNGDEPIWPEIACAANGSIVMVATRQTACSIHIIGTSDLQGWSSWISFPQLAFCGGREVWEANDVGRVGLAGVAPFQGCFLIESSNNGQTWSDTMRIVPWRFVAGQDSFELAPGIDAVYFGNTIHIVFGVQKVGTDKGAIGFWSAATGFVLAVPPDSTPGVTPRLNREQWYGRTVGYPAIGLSGQTIVVSYQAMMPETSAAGFNFSDIFFLHSTDGGRHWSRPFNLSATLALDERYVSMSKYNASGTASMVYQEDPEPGSHVMPDYAPVSRNRLKYCRISDFLVGVEENHAAPAEFALHQNYPNPFNPTTTIRFQIPSSKLGFGIWNLEFVSMKVFDVLGREVATLVNEVKAPGEYSVVFDGTNLPSGVYFYRLTAGGFTETRRMIVIR
jgi:hypothetical protein